MVSKQKKIIDFKSVLRGGLASAMLCSVAGPVLAETTVPATQPETITAWTHLVVRLPRGLENAKQFGRRVKAAGYDAIITPILPASGYDREAATEMVRYFKHDLGLEVIPEFQLLGKSSRTYGAPFVKAHPELFIGEIIDPFAEYEGRPVMERLMLDLVDEYLALFEQPRYFSLGWDEYETDDIARIADRHGKTVGEVWTGTLNRVADHLLEHGVTPMIAGDQLLSAELASPDNPLGYPADPRFLSYSAMFSRFPPWPSANTQTDLLPWVSDIANRDRMIVLDWHYGPDREYPSIDYFQWLGFKKVVPITWGNPLNMKNFTRYARDRGCTTHLASVWHYAGHPSVRHLLWPTVDNSILFFRDPDLAIPDAPEVVMHRDGVPTLTAKPGDTLTLALSPTGVEVEFELYPLNRMTRQAGEVITIHGGGSVEWTVPSDARTGLWTLQGYSSRDDGYLLHAAWEGGLYIGEDETAYARKGDMLLGANFADTAPLGESRDVMPLSGTGGTRFGFVDGNAEIIDGALICRGAGGLVIGRNSADIAAINAYTTNQTIRVEFTPDQLTGTLLTWGRARGRVRLFISEGKVAAELGRVWDGGVLLTGGQKLIPGETYVAVQGVIRR